ncbi:MAG: 7-carboxy-7-deazaguanine synthase QueE [Chitinophagales bacterium]|nr:7-carboxy-7-deazaguanine synthase QueE [Chitinophagales bacterium]MDW8427075.1 7-carboxy-7-deazaguanine synthase QueE [Chitinophagales bacterium]
MELFYSIQGEGFYQGHAAIFIRLAGCDVGCVWCDVKESWDASRYPLLSYEEIAARLQQYPASICVVTGGEPTLYPLDQLTEIIHAVNKRAHLETAATEPISGKWDWICISPKKFKKPLEQNLPLANELKVVIYHSSDLQWAEQYAEKVSAHCQLFLQPEWSRRERIMPLLTDYVRAHPKWQISLQIHKYLNVP